MRVVKKQAPPPDDAQRELIISLFHGSENNSERAIIAQTGFSMGHVRRTLNAYLDKKVTK